MLKRSRAVCLLALAGMAGSALALPVTLPARAVHYHPESQAWAQVEAIAPMLLRTAVPARVSEIRVTPGQQVTAGEPLVGLAGPQLTSQIASARARLRAAQRELTAAQHSAASAQRTYPVVTNRQQLAAAQAALAAAQGQLAEAKAAVTALHAQQWLTSPVPATVDTVSAAVGTDLPAGTPVLTLLPHGQLWLRAEWFDRAPVPSHVTARFIPAEGGHAIPVHLTAELPSRGANGAQVLNFSPTGKTDWQAGETGELVVSAPLRTAVEVPASALVLDAGKWYVLTDVKGKLAPQQVTPGPTRGSDVLITGGLKAGVAVVVREAYLLYHRHVATQYESLD